MSRSYLPSSLSKDETPDPPYYAEALSRYRSGDFRGALRVLLQSQPGFPDHVGTMYGLGMSYIRIGDKENAVRWLNETLKHNRRHPGALKALETLSNNSYGKSGPVLSGDRGGQLHASARAQTKRRPSLAQDLDADLPIDPIRLPGAVLWTGRRRLISHKRLLFGSLSLFIWAAQGGPMFLVVGVIGVVAAFLNYGLSAYTVYERAIDISEGVLKRSHRTIWLYNVLDIQLHQTPMLMLAHTGSLVMHLDHESVPTRRRKKHDSPTLRAFGSISELDAIRKTLRAMAERERRGMKKMWI